MPGPLSCELYFTGASCPDGHIPITSQYHGSALCCPYSSSSDIQSLIICAYVWYRPSDGTAIYSALPTESPFAGLGDHTLWMKPLTLTYPPPSKTSSPTNSATPSPTSSIPRSTSSPSALTEPKPKSNNQMRIGLAVGVSLGVLVIASILAAVLLFLRRRRRRPIKINQNEPNDGAAAVSELHDKSLDKHKAAKELSGVPRFEMEDTSSPAELAGHSAENGGSEGIVGNNLGEDRSVTAPNQLRSEPNIPQRSEGPERQE
ncbi:hypothetical protein CC80DRAFT_502594 [Byssothecium circinans]|uniref:Uncharacterized protein n=1 Tax=Byssothecium circinans TaxID=147558 RepID=A0A6A5U145_9PLEO|nr:hypothetical protein CC80DRAFT_502594 [Byssothecium circinans]